MVNCFWVELEDGAPVLKYRNFQMKKLALIFALALATTTPAFARAGGGGGHGGFHGWNAYWT